MQKNIRKKKDSKGRKDKLIHCMDRGNNFINHRRMMQQCGYDFDVVSTNSTRQLIVKKSNGRSTRYMYSDTMYRFIELNMFKQLKREVHQNIEEGKLSVPEYTAKDVKYFQYSDFIRSVRRGETIVLKNCLELDINMAYYKTANNLGYISKEFYNKCKDLPKMQRLRLIGSMATNKTIYEYRGGKLVDVKNEKDELLRRVWFHICRYVDQCMQEFAFILGDKFLFYWVDGIYMTGNKLPAQLAYASLQHQFNFKPNPIDKIEMVCNEQNELIMRLHKGDVIKPFNAKKDLSEYTQRLIERNREILELKTD